MLKLLIATTVALMLWTSSVGAATDDTYMDRLNEITVKLFTNKAITREEWYFYKGSQYWLGVRGAFRAVYGYQYGDACDPPFPNVFHQAEMDGSLDGAVLARGAEFA